MKAFILAASALFLIVPTLALAQTPVAIDGLQVIAERQYASNPEGSLDATGDGVFLVSARIYAFDTSDQAESTWRTLVAADVVASDLPTDDNSYTYETTELEDVGDRATVLSLSAELDDGSTPAFRTVIIQKDAVILTVTAIAGSADAATMADDIAIAMSDREIGEEDAIYDGLGGSTGGVWEIFLPADADELGELAAYADKETRPA